MPLLPREVTEGPLAPVYLVTGTEPLLVERSAAAVEERALPEVAPASFNASHHRASDADAEDAIAAARTPPMMAERRLVVVRELEAGTDAFFGALDAYLADPNPQTILVLSGRGFPAVRKGGRNWSALVGGKAKKAGVVIKLGDRDADPVAFAREHALALGHELEPEAARLLVALAGTDLSTVARQVDKVTLYVGPGARVDPAAVSEACSALAETEVWDLTAAVARRDGEGALLALQRLLAQEVAEHQILGLLGWQLRVILKVAEAVRQGRPESEVQQAAGRLSRDAYRKLRGAVGPGTPGAAEALEALARANRLLNSARVQGGRILEAFVLQVTDVPTAAR
ncbi:MAG: DNA polymerase III subunit delta [Alphaproteobacteria bacterium]|nr:DNA polymerase III subunit delta [Alphaproteobacteria bacterium]